MGFNFTSTQITFLDHRINISADIIGLIKCRSQVSIAHLFPAKMFFALKTLLHVRNKTFFFFCFECDKIRNGINNLILFIFFQTG